MEARDAIALIYRVWGAPGCLSARDASAIAAVELPGETPLGTLCRIAGIDQATLAPFDFRAVHDACQAALARLRA